MILVKQFLDVRFFSILNIYYLIILFLSLCILTIRNYYFWVVSLCWITPLYEGITKVWVPRSTVASHGPLILVMP
jgi:hypothetical protein